MLSVRHWRAQVYRTLPLPIWGCALPQPPAARLRLRWSGFAFSRSMVQCIRKWVSCTPSPSEITPCLWSLTFIAIHHPSSRHKARHGTPGSEAVLRVARAGGSEFLRVQRAGLLPVSSKSTRNERQSRPDFPNCSTLSSSLAESAPE